MVSQPGCLLASRIFILGGVSGVVTALAIGWMDAPVVDPRAPEAHEWYTPFALFILPFYGWIVGIFTGFLCFWPRLIYGVSGPKSSSGGFAGLFLGAVIGKILLAGRGDGGDLVFHLLVTATTTFFGFLLGPKGSKKQPWDSDEFGV